VTPKAVAAAAKRMRIVSTNLQIRRILPPGMPLKNITHRGLFSGNTGWNFCRGEKLDG
jgi:hypothetical protein